jgi:hypothetical protein
MTPAPGCVSSRPNSPSYDDGGTWRSVRLTGARAHQVAIKPFLPPTAALPGEALTLSGYPARACSYPRVTNRSGEG